MNTYTLNPNTVPIFNVSDDQQPSVAMSQLELFGNFSAPDTTQSCQLTKDFFTFDIANCYPYLINQPISENCCVELYSDNLTNIVNERVSAFDDRNCVTDGNTYENRVNAMVNYGNSISEMIKDIAPITESASTPMRTYEASYYAYYT